MDEVFSYYYIFCLLATHYDDHESFKSDNYGAFNKPQTEDILCFIIFAVLMVSSVISRRQLSQCLFGFQLRTNM